MYSNEEAKLYLYRHVTKTVIDKHAALKINFCIQATIYLPKKFMSDKRSQRITV